MNLFLYLCLGSSIISNIFLIPENIPLIARNCRIKSLTSRKFIWRFSDEELTGKDIDKLNEQNKRIYMYSLRGEFIKIFDNLSLALK